MDKNPTFIRVKNNPVDAVYFRNHCCGSYDECLRHAALINHHLDCSGCAHKSLRSLRPLEDCEIEGCLNLLNAIFRS